nr:hypothetical protein [Thiocystis violacea]
MSGSSSTTRTFCPSLASALGEVERVSWSAMIQVETAWETACASPGEVELDPEEAADPRRALHADLPTHEADQLLAQRETDAGPLDTQAVGPEPAEGLEELGQAGRLDTAAGIPDAQPQALAAHVAEHLQLTLLAVVLDGVGEQVEDHLAGPVH